MRATVRTAALLGASLTAAAASLTAAAPAGATAGAVVVHDDLRDLRPAVADPVDGARASLELSSAAGWTTIVLTVQGIDRSAAGRPFGAHLHVGPCVAGDGAAAGPHYNSDVVAGAVTPRVDATTEVWLDFTVTPAGTAHAVARVPFVPLPGDRAIVVHRDPTDEHGLAGPRLACLPVSW
ncbi:MAG TPA: hypothetical protein VGJ44_11940 [Kribbellaceae bacterium]